ncbi:Ankyrin repeat-containing domain [Cinara cedri]|uniref:Ankyrin repeat-containing domain n=1 Tax=Cinara cedri TaxID=506608 RepID=A0A5E4MA13_9HEMI|nr:Ankyrin repeat-containing domain [Cinara cedri]
MADHKGNGNGSDSIKQETMPSSRVTSLAKLAYLNMSDDMKLECNELMPNIKDCCVTLFNMFRRRTTMVYGKHLYDHRSPMAKPHQKIIAAVKSGNLDWLMIAHGNRQLPGNPTSYLTALYNLPCLRFALENALDGNLECIMYLHRHGCNWIEETCNLAAKNGHFDCLVYAHQKGCPWNSNTCAEAAAGGHLQCLVYAFENGCPWNQDTTRSAAVNGHLNCLWYALSNDCPINMDNVIRLLNDMNTEYSAQCLKFIKSWKE